MLQILRGIVWTYLIFTLILFVPKSISHNIPLSVGLQEIVLGWASWFVVALGVAQVMFGWVLSKTKNHKAISTFSLVCLILGYCISIWYPERLPYYFD